VHATLTRGALMGQLVGVLLLERAYLLDKKPTRGIYKPRCVPLMNREEEGKKKKKKFLFFFFFFFFSFSFLYLHNVGLVNTVIHSNSIGSRSTVFGPRDASFKFLPYQLSMVG
jgi:hypothetical protein